jgi:PPK2 family polyphosphate:nucleotide phosphotransferase
MAVAKSEYKKIRKLIKPYRVTNGRKFRLKDVDPGDTGGLKSEMKVKSKEFLARGVELLADEQARLYAQDRWGVLMIFQAMDAAGKDGAIKHVTSGIDPQGMQVYSFKAPSSEELDHDFMWRCMRALPERGRIGVFNRSYYEEVLAVRVHEAYLLKQKLPRKLVTKKVWDERYQDIRSIERYLSRNGYLILKFFLHVSKKEQKKRFMERLDRPDKNWKFSAADAGQRHADIYGPDGSSNYGIGAPSIWQRLLVDDNHVVGKLQYASTDFSLDVEFSAPVFGSDGKVQMLSGAQAQKSPQAEAFPAFVSGTLEHIALLFQDVPAALVAMLVLCVALIAAAIWLARKSLAQYRIIQAIRTAPTVKTNSDARGLVKVVGEAQPGGEAPGGEAKPRDVWSQSETINQRSSSHYLSVEPILVQDAAGGLIVDPRQAVIVPGTIEGTMHNDFFHSKKPDHTTWSIRSGAPVFAIGIIHRGKHRPGERPSHGALSKSDHGVLLLSAKTESRTLIRFHLRLWPMAAGAALCAWEGVHLMIAFVLPWTPQLR